MNEFNLYQPEDFGLFEERMLLQPEFDPEFDIELESDDLEEF